MRRSYAAGRRDERPPNRQKGIAKALDVSMGELGKLTDSFDTKDLPQRKRLSRRKSS